MSFIVESGEDYAKREGVRATILKEILKSPAHARELMANPKPATSAMELGTAIHSAILEPDQFEKYIVSPKFDRRTKEGKAAAADFEASNQGRIVVDQETYSTIKGCVKAVYSHKAARSEVETGRCEQTVVWNEDEIICKARPDIYRNGIVVDVKTCQDASLPGFARQVANLKYHVQAYHYLRGVSAMTGVEHEVFRIVAVETKAPFAVAVYELDFGTMEKAAQLWQHALDLYRQCSSLDEWPAYSDEIQPLAIPSWAFGELEAFA